MSQFSSPLARGGLGTVPTGEEVASFATYAEAQHAVDSLSDDGFPVQYLAIIGTDLRQVERITGRMSWGRAVASGAGAGLWIGIFFAAMMGMFSPSGTTGVTIAAAVLMGVVWGILFQAVAYGLTRGKRDFTSVSQVVASRYSIIAAERASEAAQALASVAGNLTRGGEAARRAERRRAARDGAGAGAPTAFGSRLDEQPRFGVRVPEGTSAEEYAARAVTPRSAEEAGEQTGEAGSAVVAGEAGTGGGRTEDPYLRPTGGRHRAGGEEER